MLRFLGILFSGAIVASVVIPWVSGPQTGDLSLFDMVKGIDPSRINIRQLQQAFSTPINGDPMNAAPWALAAFAVSFLLAALFAVIGLMGHYSKPMAILLAALPIGVAGFAVYAGNRVSGIFPTGFGTDALTQLGQAVSHQGITFGWGMPLYLGSAILLLFSALFSASRR